jgi:Kazal-type serine protease inhibitor domain.|tara:strand:+ start:355 stop:576 length:222 start_codon:yes stop_codon:yes gene_type:complete
MKKLHFLVLIVVISCSKDKENDQKCIDESLIDVTSACIEIYDPVCGCNGITYPNSCYATTFNGVKSFTKGACD